MRPKSAIDMLASQIQKANQIQRTIQTNLHYKGQGSHQCQVSPSKDQMPIIRRILSTSISPQNVSTRSQPGFFGGEDVGMGYTPGFFSTILCVVDKCVFSVANLLDVLKDL
jgi:hypothetical protein